MTTEPREPTMNRLPSLLDLLFEAIAVLAFILGLGLLGLPTTAGLVSALALTLCILGGAGSIIAVLRWRESP